MKIVQWTSIISLLLIVGYACDSGVKSDVNENESSVSSRPLPENDEAEKYVYELDNKELQVGNSLYYSKEDGSMVEVEIFANDSSQVVKMVEEYTKGSSGSIERNIFYYKDNRKYVTKEYFESKAGESTNFVERVTYYDNKGNAKVSKMRIALYEDLLENESFKVITAKDCSDKRAYKVLNQVDEFETTFQGFVQVEHLTYLIVGENKRDGYSSSLIVQEKTPVIQKLLSNEKAMLGKPLVVEYEKHIGEMGFEFQALLSVDFK